MHEPQPDLTPLFRRAFEILDDAEPDGDTAAYIRAHVARLAQQVRVADALGGSLDDAIAAEAQLVRNRALPERREEIERLAELNQTAKRRFFDGDQQGAEVAYLSAEDLRDSHERWGLLGAHVAFLGWLLEAGDLCRSMRFLQATDWASPFTQVAMARQVADALGKAGRRPDGVNFLRSLRPALDVTDAHMTLTYLGKALWAIGETEEGVTVIREAARASLSRAAQDAKVPLWGYSSSEPIALAQLQCTIADREGAVDTLNGALGLAVPIEYDPPPPRPPDLPAKTLWFSGGPTLKPAAERWISSLPHLIRVLARAGLDAEAFSLVARAQIAQLKLLAELTRGQARRGDYTEAFRTLDGMKTADAFEANEPSRVTIKPDGAISAFQQTSPIRPAEALERNAVVRSSLNCIRHYAAETGDSDAFHLANRLFEQFPDPNPLPGVLETDFLRLDLLVHQGEFDQALTSVEIMSPPRKRLLALRHVMDRAVKASRSTRDDVLAACYR